MRKLAAWVAGLYLAALALYLPVWWALFFGGYFAPRLSSEVIALVTCFLPADVFALATFIGFVSGLWRRPSAWTHICGFAFLRGMRHHHRRVSRGPRHASRGVAVPRRRRGHGVVASRALSSRHAGSRRRAKRFAFRALGTDYPASLTVVMGDITLDPFEPVTLWHIRRTAAVIF